MSTPEPGRCGARPSRMAGLDGHRISRFARTLAVKMQQHVCSCIQNGPAALWGLPCQTNTAGGAAAPACAKAERVSRVCSRTIHITVTHDERPTCLTWCRGGEQRAPERGGALATRARTAMRGHIAAPAAAWLLRLRTVRQNDGCSAPDTVCELDWRVTRQFLLFKEHCSAHLPGGAPCSFHPDVLCPR